MVVADMAVVVVVDVEAAVFHSAPAGGFQTRAGVEMPDATSPAITAVAGYYGGYNGRGYYPNSFYRGFGHGYGFPLYGLGTAMGQGGYGGYGGYGGGGAAAGECGGVLRVSRL